MKKILLNIILILGCFIANGQFGITQNLGGPNTLVQNPNYGGLKGGLIPFAFADTTAANLTNLKYYDGAIIKTLSPAALHYRNLARFVWVQIFPNGSGTDTLAWRLQGNDVTGMAAEPFLGTNDNFKLNLGTFGQKRLVIPANGIVRSTSSALKILAIDTTAGASNGNMYYTDAGGTTPTWQQTLTAGSTLTGANTIVMSASNLIFNTANGGTPIFQSDDVGNIVMGFKKDVDVTNRLQLQADGHLEWSNGTIGPDVGLTRLSEGVLELNGTNRTFFSVETDGITGGIRFTKTSALVKAAFYFDEPNNTLITEPYLGNYTIDSLNNVSAQNTLIGWTTTAGANRGKVGYITLGSGLNLTTPGVLNVSAGAGMVYPGAGIPNSTGSAWGTSYSTTGSGTVVALQTSPSFVTSVIGGASFDAFNTVSTTLNIGGAATTFALGGTPTTALTANIFTNATATATTKTINFGTGGAAGSTTNINIGSTNGGAITHNSIAGFPVASESAPSVYWGSDNNSGFFQVADGTLSYSSNGVTYWTAVANTGGTPSKSLRLDDDMEIGWSTSPNTVAEDIWIYRTGAGSLGLSAGTSAAEFRFLEPSGSGTNYAGFKAPALAGNTIYTLPTAFPAGNNYLVNSSTAGVLSFTDPATFATPGNITTAIAAQGNVIHTTENKGTSFTAVSGFAYVLSATISADVVTLPSSPVDGDLIILYYTTGGGGSWDTDVAFTKPDGTTSTSLTVATTTVLRWDNINTIWRAIINL